MIYRINCLRANLVRKDIESTILNTVSASKKQMWDTQTLIVSPSLFRVDVMLRRMERLRRRRWAPWKDKR